LTTETRKQIRRYFDDVRPRIFWPRDLSNLVDDYRRKQGEFDLSVQQVINFLLKEGILHKAEFRSRRYRSIIRYLKGSPSPYELAVSLRRDSFLCHETALVLHGLEPPTTTIYVNKEQGPRPSPERVTQEGINRAFKNRQRQSNYKFRYGASEFVLLSGKNTRNAGVVLMPTSSGAAVDTTDLERTLIDIAVRPAYAGGLRRVLSAYKQAASKIDIDHMIGLLRKLNHAYPYHQSIGFLLQGAERPERDCKRFQDLGVEFDFYLDYGLKHPAYDRKWRLYIPPFLT
jgi:hypothetical protein